MNTQTQKLMDHFGLDESDRKALDPYVDWEALAKSIDNPTKLAVCNILDGNGKIVMNEGKLARVIMEVPVENVEEELKKKSMRFVEWWD